MQGCALCSADGTGGGGGGGGCTYPASVRPEDVRGGVRSLKLRLCIVVSILCEDCLADEILPLRGLQG